MRQAASHLADGVAPRRDVTDRREPTRKVEQARERMVVEVTFP